MYEEVQNSKDGYNVRWLSYICSSKTKIESTTVVQLAVYGQTVEGTLYFTLPLRLNSYNQQH